MREVPTLAFRTQTDYVYPYAWHTTNDLYSELVWRGLINQTTDDASIRASGEFCRPTAWPTVPLMRLRPNDQGGTDIASANLDSKKAGVVIAYDCRRKSEEI